MCNRTVAQNGKPCNPDGKAPASATGGCSGLPIDNYMDLVILQRIEDPTYMYCDPYLQVPDLNKFRVMRNRSPKWYSFLDYDGDNLGVTPDSKVYSRRRKFRSCDRNKVGPRRAKIQRYLSSFNGDEPDGFSDLLNMNTLHIMDILWTGT